jgi:anti-anti-sigma regulatory factor
MGSNAVSVTVDGECVAQALREALEKLDTAEAEVVLDFSCVHRLDADALRAMENLADTVDGKGPKLVLSNVNIDLYKVLKLMKLTSRFAFRA